MPNQTFGLGPAWSNGFSSGFGPLPFPVSSRNHRDMATLGKATSQTLYYDYGETEDFYVLVDPPMNVVTTLYIVSPLYASRWFGLNPLATQVYNPFSFDLSKYPLSTVV